MPYKNPELRRKNRRIWYWKNHDANLIRKRREAWKVQGIAITIDQWKTLLDKQQGKCAICERPEKNFKKALAVDHDHITGEIRGLLCFSCNRFLVNLIERTPNLVAKAIRYLNEHKRDHKITEPTAFCIPGF